MKGKRREEEERREEEKASKRGEEEGREGEGREEENGDRSALFKTSTQRRRVGNPATHPTHVHQMARGVRQH